MILTPEQKQIKRLHAQAYRELKKIPGGLDGLEIYYDENGVPFARGGKVFKPSRIALNVVGSKRQTKPKPKETHTMACIERGEYKFNPILIIKKSPEDKFPFQFGLSKARMICENIEAIRQFVADNEKSKAA